MAWEKYVQVAQRFLHKAKPEDRDDLKQDIILRLAEVENNNGHEPFTEAKMMRVAGNVVKEYWHNLKRQPQIWSLNLAVEKGDGHPIELGETIADETATDPDAWLDAKHFLACCPDRMVEVARRMVNHQPVTKADYSYLEYHRHRELRRSRDGSLEF